MVDDALKRIGEVLKKIRISNNLSLKDMANLCDVTPSYLSDIENSKKVPSIQMLNNFSKSLKIEMTEFFSVNNSSEIDTLINILRDLHCVMKSNLEDDDNKIKRLLSQYSDFLKAGFLASKMDNDKDKLSLTNYEEHKKSKDYINFEMTVDLVVELYERYIPILKDSYC